MLGVCVFASTALAQPKKQEPIVDHASVAEKIVGKTANVKEGELVQIMGGPGDLALLEELALAVRKRGAHAIITYNSETLAKKAIAGVPEKYDASSEAFDQALAKIVSVRIQLPAVRDPSIVAGVSGARRAAWQKAHAQSIEIRIKRKVRTIDVDNGFAPSPSRAKALGISETDLTKLFWDGVSADYAPIEEKAKALKATLAKGGELHITHPNGTDVKMKIKGRKVLVSDGVISDEDKKDVPGAWLPAGEVYLSPVPGSTSGKIVDDRLLYDGKEITGLTIEVKAGKITNISAKTGWEAVQPTYDAAGPGKTEIGVFDIGINPAIKTTPKLESYVGAGTVTIGMGQNLWAGGTNKEPFSLYLHLPGTTVMLDGKPLIENGALK